MEVAEGCQGLGGGGEVVVAVVSLVKGNKLSVIR